MALPKVGVQLVAQDASDFINTMGRAQDATGKFTRELDNAGPRFGVFEQIAAGAFQRVGHMVTDFAAQGVRALGDFAVQSVTLAGDYEATLNRFSSVTGASLSEAGYEVEDFSKLFLQLGADTQFSAQQAADAGVALAKGGVPIKDIMGDATQATLALAAAGELELAPAAEIVAKQLGVWGDRGVTATMAADLLAQAANASTVDVEELALGLANVGGTAKVAGVSFEETVQTMALLAPGFSSASDAGTSYKTFLSRLIPTTDTATAAMMDLGLYTEGVGSVFYDSTGSFVGMEEAARLLNEATADLSEEQKLLAFNTIFGQDAIRAAAIISEQGAAGFTKMGESMAKAGTASAQAAERNKGFNFALESLKGSFETIQILIGTAVLPTLTAFINETLIPGADAVMAFVTALSESNDPLALLGSMLSSVGQQIAAGLPMIRQAFLDWALAAATWVLDSMPMLLANLSAFVQGAADWAVGAAVQFGEQMLAFGQALVVWIAPRLPELGNQLGAFLNSMTNWVVDSLPRWGEQLAAFGKKAIEWVIDALPGLATNLGLFAGNLLSWLIKTIGEVAPKLAELAARFVMWLWNDVLPHLPGALDAVWGALATFVQTAVANIGPELVKLANRFVDWIQENVIPYLPAGLQRVWDTIVEWVGKAVGWAGEELKALGSAIVGGIVSGLGGLADALYQSLKSGISGALDSVKSFFGIQSPSRVFRDEVGINIMTGIVEGVTQTAPLLETGVTDSIQAAMDAGDFTAQAGVQSINGTLEAGLSQAQSFINMLQGQAQQAAQIQGMIAGFGGSGGRSIQPVASGGAISNISTVNNGPSLSYSPTYNSPAPPPALDLGTLRAMAQG